MSDYPKTCPHCSADLTVEDAIRTDELTPGTCYAYVDEDGSLEFDGDTRLCWDAQTTESVRCDACSRRLDDPPDLCAIVFKAEACETAHDRLASMIGWTVDIEHEDDSYTGTILAVGLDSDGFSVVSFREWEGDDAPEATGRVFAVPAYGSKFTVH